MQRLGYAQNVMPDDLRFAKDRRIVVLGSFAADLSFRTPRIPAWGETLMGSEFAVGPGGKGSNQAVAAALAGAQVQIVTKLGRDSFGPLAREVWAKAGVDAALVLDSNEATGAAAILVDQQRGENAIIIVPGACYTLTAEDVERMGEAFRAARVVLTQFELPLSTVERGLVLARRAGVATILNPAPVPLEKPSDTLLHLADFLIPNESEAALLTGLPVSSVEQAGVAAAALQSRGAHHVIVTLGRRGALVCMLDASPVLVPAFVAGACVDTTGAGDAFCGGFAAALAEGQSVVQAARFACAAAGLSVTHPGTANAMPQRQEIDQLLLADSMASGEAG